MTDLANSCVTPLFRRPQGSQGCLEKQNHPLSSNLVVWCAKIGPKTKKVKKTSELTKKIKNDCFLTVFLFLEGPRIKWVRDRTKDALIVQAWNNLVLVVTDEVVSDDFLTASRTDNRGPRSNI